MNYDQARRAEFRRFVYVWLLILASAAAVPFVMQGCAPLAAHAQRIGKMNGEFIQTPEYPVYRMRVQGATPGQQLCIDSNGYVAGGNCAAGAALTGPQFKLFGAIGPGSGSSYQSAPLQFGTDATGSDLLGVRNFTGTSVQANQVQSVLNAQQYSSMANAVAALPTGGGIIDVPSTYSGGEAVPWFSAPDDTMIRDYRYGGVSRYFKNSWGATGDTMAWSRYHGDAVNAQLDAQGYNLLQEIDDPGYTIGSGPSPYTATGWAGLEAFSLDQEDLTAGINSIFHIHAGKTAAGDTQLFDISASTSFGAVTREDEGFHLWRSQIDENGTQTTTITALGASNGDQTLTTSSGVTGPLQPVIDLTQGVSATQAATTAPSGDPVPAGLAVEAITGASFTESTCGTLTSDVLVSRAVDGGTTSATMTVSAPWDSGTSWAANTPLFIFSPYSHPERVNNPTLSGNTFTANFHYQHASGDLVCQGGPAGEYVDQTDYDLGGNKYVSYVIGALNATTLVEGVVTGGDASWKSLAADGPVIVYPGADVVEGNKMTGSSGDMVYYGNTVRVEPGGPFAVGDSVAFLANIVGNISMFWPLDQTVSAYVPSEAFNATIKGQVFRPYGQGVAAFSVELNDQSKLHDKVGGLAALYPPDVMHIGTANSGKEETGSWFVGSAPPTGGYSYSSPNNGALLKVTGCWTSNSTQTSTSSYNVFEQDPDGATLSYTPTCNGGSGMLAWNKGFSAVSLTLKSNSGVSCSASTAGQFNYIAGGTGVKDTVQVCAKDATDAYAWRTIY